MLRVARRPYDCVVQKGLFTYTRVDSSSKSCSVPLNAVTIAVLEEEEKDNIVRLYHESFPKTCLIIQAPSIASFRAWQGVIGCQCLSDAPFLKGDLQIKQLGMFWKTRECVIHNNEFYYLSKERQARKGKLTLIIACLTIVDKADLTFQITDGREEANVVTLKALTKQDFETWTVALQPFIRDFVMSERLLVDEATVAWEPCCCLLSDASFTAFAAAPQSPSSSASSSSSSLSSSDPTDATSLVVVAIELRGGCSVSIVDAENLLLKVSSTSTTSSGVSSKESRRDSSKKKTRAPNSIVVKAPDLASLRQWQRGLLHYAQVLLVCVLRLVGWFLSRFALGQSFSGELIRTVMQ